MMDRRRFIQALAAGAAGLGIAGWLGAPGARDVTIELALERLRGLEGRSLRARGEAWHPARALHHCGQSVLCSMDGYPVHKPQWFTSFVGPAALTVFTAAGKLAHDTAEEVPGLPPAETGLEVETALADLIDVYERFASYRGQLKPHFAYGGLSKREYEVAHVLHLLDHLDEIDAT